MSDDELPSQLGQVLAQSVDALETAGRTADGTSRLHNAIELDDARAVVDACRYGRFVVRASNVSATAKIRAEIGIASPARPSG